MTNDEAINVLKNAVYIGATWIGDEKQFYDLFDAVKMAVKALKRETSGDAVSRQAVIDAVERNSCNTQRAIDAVNALPSVQPEPCSDAISRQGAIDHFKSIADATSIGNKYNEGFVDGLNFAVGHLETMPSVQPERLSDDDFETIRIHLSAIKERLGNQHRWKEAEDYQRLIDRFMSFAERPEIMSDGTLHITVNADVANIDRILLTQAGTHTGDLYYKDDEKPEPQWIPVTERLPEPRMDVWVNSDIGQIQGYYEENVKIWYASFGQGRDYLELIVNAWMPLPEPYKEEGE
jgi:hypothetical protein